MNDTKNNPKEKLTFSKIEIIFIIVMVAIVIVVGITVFSVTTNKKNISNFKTDTSAIISAAKNAYASFNTTLKTDNIVIGSDGTTKGMCITIKGLKENDFIETDRYDDWDGYIVIEESETKTYNYTAWITNKKYVIDGYDSTLITSLTTDDGITKYNDDSFTTKVKTSFTGTSSTKGGTGNSDGSSLLRYETNCIDEKVE